MTKKSFVIILIISVITTYGATFIDALINNTLLGGISGFPFKYSSSTLFGHGSVNGLMLILDIAFWFTIVWGIRRMLQKTSKKKK